MLYGEPAEHLGEVNSDFVPASLIRGAVAQMGGLPEGAAGIADDGTMVRGPGGPTQPAVGPGTGIEVVDIMRGADARVAHWTWEYPPNPRQHFEPHRELDGIEFSSWTDARLDAGADAAWIGPYLHPGDHQGCLCLATPIWSMPAPSPQLEGVS